ncbi:MAG: hypothetical protein ACTII7_00765 [Galactobacter sp.]
MSTATHSDTDQVSGWVAVVVAVVIGLVTGVVALLWQGWSTVLSNSVVLPWGALLGVATIFGGAWWWGLSTRVRWAPGLVGLVAFGLLSVVSLGGQDTFMPPLSSAAFDVAPGAAWSALVVMAGTVVATIAALLLTARVAPGRPARTSAR